jgi:hypothetical protein
MTSVIVNYFNIFGAGPGPQKTKAPLPVDADTVLAQPIAPQSLEPIAGRHCQVGQAVGDLELPEFSPRCRGNASESFDRHAV